MRVLAALILLALPACGTLTPPNAVVWGVPVRYEMGAVGDGLAGQAVMRGGVCRVTLTDVNVFLVAHEATHCHDRTYGLSPAWEAAPPVCWIQEAHRCTPHEAHADAVARAVIRAGCDTGDLGWPGGRVTGCTLPDPRQVAP